MQHCNSDSNSGLQTVQHFQISMSWTVWHIVEVSWTQPAPQLSGTGLVRAVGQEVSASVRSSGSEANTPAPFPLSHGVGLSD